jgi:hypothetical protein
MKMIVMSILIIYIKIVLNITLNNVNINKWIYQKNKKGF